MEDEESKLKEALNKLGKSHCGNCQKEIGLIDVSWNNRSTEQGTPYSVMQITCQSCDTEVLHEETWNDIESINDFITSLNEI